MTRFRLFAISFLIITLLSSLASFAATPHVAAKKAKVKVIFLAKGTTTYSSFSGNRDEYLASILSTNGSSFSVVKLSHDYRPYQEGLPFTIINSGKTVPIVLRREPQCDTPFLEFATAWRIDAYGSALRQPILAPLAGKQVPDIRDTQILPCYVFQGSSKSAHAR
jgi:hypothetical protein